MTARTLTEPSYLCIPPSSLTLGDEVAEVCEAANFGPDLQQQLILDAVFGRREDGLSAAFETGIIAGRQNLKTGSIKQICIGWQFVLDERMVIYSAHNFSTAMEMFRDYEELVGSSDFLRKRVRRVVRNHGEQAVELKTGARVLFRTRTEGGGRGLSGNKVVLDEGYALTEAHVGALMPTLSAQPDPQIIYGSAAGLAMSDVLREIRDRGRARSSAPWEKPDEEEPLLPPGRMAWIEWCAPPPEIACDAGKQCTHAKNAKGCGCDKPVYWKMANPAMGLRISEQYISAERQAMPVGEFMRERMGWWDDPLKGKKVVSLGSWYTRQDEESTPRPGSPLALAFHITPDNAMSAVALAGYRADGQMHIELVEHLPGTDWLMDRIKGIVERRHPIVLVCDPSGPAGAYEKELRSSGFIVRSASTASQPVPLAKTRLHLMTLRDYAEACQDFLNRLDAGSFRHPGQSPLNAAMGRARAVSQGKKMWIWDEGSGDDRSEDVTPVVAVTQALMGLVVYGNSGPQMPFLIT